MVRKILFAMSTLALVVSCNSQKIQKATVVTVEGDTIEFVGGSIDKGDNANGYWRAYRMTRITPIKN